MSTLFALREEGIPDHWADDKELLAHLDKIEREREIEEARLDDLAARNSATQPALFGEAVTVYEWSPRVLRREVLKAPLPRSTSVSTDEQPSLAFKPANRQYTKERSGNLYSFEGMELQCLQALLEATEDDLMQNKVGTRMFYDCWLWIRLPDSALQPFSFAACCQAKGLDPDEHREYLEVQLLSRLGRDRFVEHCSNVLKLAIAESSRTATSLDAWMAIGTMRDQLIAMTQLAA